MTDQDRLADAKALVENILLGWGDSLGRDVVRGLNEVIHLVDGSRQEVERLRGLRQRLREIEWSASLPAYGEDCGHFSTEAGCPACEQSSLDGHAPDCWLAAALA